MVRAAGPDAPATRGVHIGFAAASREAVDAFWRAGTEGGYADDGAPGPRPQYGPDYYGGFLLDPDGNSAEAVHHDETGDRDTIDHLWIRVADVAAARDFYAELAPHAGLRRGTDEPGRAQFVGAHGTFSLVAGDTPTRHAALAFPATGGGGRIGLSPSDPRELGPSGDVTLDPDGNEVEVWR